MRFSDAAAALEDPQAVTVPDAHADEERFVTMGLDALLRVVVVSWTWREGGVRLISARKANAHERRAYEEG